MKLLLSIVVFPVFIIGASCKQAPLEAIAASNTSSSDSVLAWLKAGNNEYIHGQFNMHGIDTSLRINLSKEQHPKAVILTCSDSRVPPELIFNKGLVDLFVIRVAGNISDDAVVGSIEYAVEHLHTSLVVVMGHTSCGAVGAAVADLQSPKNEINDHIRSLTDKIEQAITTVNMQEKDLNEKALLSNIIFTVTSLSNSKPDLEDAVKKGNLKIVGAVYDLKTGRVQWL
jgi:carbonic anhydrase